MNRLLPLCLLFLNCAAFIDLEQTSLNLISPDDIDTVLYVPDFVAINCTDTPYVDFDTSIECNRLSSKALKDILNLKKYTVKEFQLPYVGGHLEKTYLINRENIPEVASLPYSINGIDSSALCIVELQRSMLHMMANGIAKDSFFVLNPALNRIADQAYDKLGYRYVILALNQTTFLSRNAVFLKNMINLTSLMASRFTIFYVHIRPGVSENNVLFLDLIDKKILWKKHVVSENDFPTAWRYYDLYWSDQVFKFFPTKQ